MKSRIVVVFSASLLLLLTSLYLFNQVNKNRLKHQANALTQAQGKTIHDFINVVGKQFHTQTRAERIAFLEKIFDNPKIVYIGLMKGDRLEHLLSRYEGYFPVVPGQDMTVVLESPVGKILNVRGEFRDRQGVVNQLYIGFDYYFLTNFEKTALRNYLIISAIFILLFIFITLTVLWLTHQNLLKQQELEQEKQHKKHFEDLSLLTAQIAHEIKNPLNSLYLSFQALEKHFDSSTDASFYKESIKGEIKRINNIIQSYSVYAKQSEPRLGVLPLGDFFKDLKALYREELKINDAELVMKGTENVTLNTDHQILKQIFINLIANALQAKAKRITVMVVPDQTAVSLRITDNGAGFDAEILDRVFTPFTTSKRSGMGLGLYIVHKLVKRLQGSIKLVSSQPGHTEFEIVFFHGGRHASK